MQLHPIKASLIARVQALLEPLEEKRFIFHPNTITSLCCYGDIVNTTLTEILISETTGKVLLFSHCEYTTDDYDLDPIEELNTTEIETIANILETQLKRKRNK